MSFCNFVVAFALSVIHILLSICSRNSAVAGISPVRVVTIQESQSILCNWLCYQRHGQMGSLNEMAQVVSVRIHPKGCNCVI